jgi:prepilin-type N-terminal cleavage/methylation domain-containing protein
MTCPSPPKIRKSALGFTLAEILITLTILGVIATFSIPKIINAQQNQSYNAKAKEAAAMVTAAFQIAKAEGNISSASNFSSLTGYMNYLAVDTTTVIDALQTTGSSTCTSGEMRCLRLHNGAMLRYSDWRSFGGTNTTNAIWFEIDPDGAYIGTTNGAGKAIQFWMYYNGRISTYGTVQSNTCNSWGCINPNPAYDPPWFSW